jgi:hypothetical protein
MSNEFVSRSIGNRNCDAPITGTPHPNFDYIIRSTTGDDNYPADACSRYLQVNGKFDNLEVTDDVDVAGTVTATTFQGVINVQSWKGFDIRHPNKENYRLRHICLEGPEAGVYHRGRLTNSNMISVPEYWIGLIDPESITVVLTQIGYSQDLIVEKIEWGKNIIVKSGTGSNIDCYYTIQASRIDGQKLIVEYEGQTPADYPGDSSQFSISGYDYGIRGVDSETPSCYDN